MIMVLSLPLKNFSQCRW